jgi:transcriptional regulator with XRE-family HTH domain
MAGCVKIKKKLPGGHPMASKKLGNLIKEARTEAGLTQEQLARKIAGLSASEISAAERGVGDLTQDQLKKIAKATGVTQASLLNAAKGTSKSTSTAAKSSMQVTATERKLVEAYRKASAQEKKAAMNALKGTGSLTEEIFEAVLDSVDTKDILESVLEGVLKK